MSVTVIGIDFDGTLVDHRYPEIGQPVPGAIASCRRLLNAGCKLVLFTTRSGATLEDAVSWCVMHEIELYGVNRNPTQDSWTQSPKAYAHIYIDDAAIGCPLRTNPRSGGRPFVDWDAVMALMAERIELETA